MRPPSDGHVRDRYGMRTNPVTGRREKHNGLDLGDEAGIVLVAPEPCTLIAYGVVPGWEVHGRVARLAGASGVEHWLSHTDHALAPAGTQLAEGDALAVQGMTGQTTGRHVHWEVRKDGRRIDPESWLATQANNAQPREDDMFTDDDRARQVRIETKLDNITKVMPVVHQITRRLAEAIYEIRKVKQLAGNALTELRAFVARK